ncbi:MAG: hypothetical protein Q9218_003704 [Villophora microphyllina]
MDPVTIVSTALATLAGIKKVSDAIESFLAATRGAQGSLTDLKDELDSLYGDIDNVHNICQDPNFRPVASASLEGSQSRTFTRLRANLDSCTNSIDRLGCLVADIAQPGTSNLINRIRVSHHLEDRADEITQFRKQIQTHRGSMHLSISALTLSVYNLSPLHYADETSCMQTQGMKMGERTGKLMNIKMNKLANVVENQSAELYRLKNQFTLKQKQGQRVSDEDTQMLQDMEQIHETTIRLKRRATILVESQTLIEADESSPTTAPAIKLKAVKADAQVDAANPHEILQRVVSAPERVPGSLQSPVRTPKLKRIISTPQATLPQTVPTAADVQLSSPYRATSPVRNDEARLPDPSVRICETNNRQPPDASLISFEDFEIAMSSSIAAAEREKKDPTKPFKEEDFIYVRSLLCQVGKGRWSERPRTYLVLRLIDEMQAMDGFVLEGLKDIHFPYTEERLPKCLLSPSSRYAFINKQSLVTSSRAADLVCQGPHRHLSMIYQSTLGTLAEQDYSLAKGGQGTVDLVKSNLSAQEYAVCHTIEIAASEQSLTRPIGKRKRIFRTRTFVKNKQALAMFEKEIHNLKRLSHIHLVKLVGSYTDPKYVGLIMDPVADIDLKHYLSLEPFPKENLVCLRSFFGCLASAMKYLHDQRCRHKDIKPGNILIKDQTVLITDFGTALDWTDLEVDATVGRPEAYTNMYAVPEVALARSRGSPADMWSLGCVFLEMVTILKGRTMEERRRFFEQTGTHSPCFHDNQQSLKQWIDFLHKKPSQDDQPLRWIECMIVEDPLMRVDANGLFEDIVSVGQVERFHGQCCGDHAESDDISWHGSDTDEENGNGNGTGTASYAKSSTISPTVTCNSAGSALPPQSPILGPRDVLDAASLLQDQANRPQNARLQKIEQPARKEKDLPLPPIDASSPRSDRQAGSRMDAAGDTDKRFNDTLPYSPTTHDRRREVPGQYHGALKAALDEYSGPIAPKPLVSSPMPPPLPRPSFVRRKYPGRADDQGPHILKVDGPILEIQLMDLRLKGLIQLEDYVQETLKSTYGEGNRTTLLHTAVRLNDPNLSRDMVKIVTDKADLTNVTDVHFNTPLYYAVESNRLLLVKHLLSHGADVSCANVRGQTALHIAVRQHQTSMVSILLRQSKAATVDASDDSGQTALHLACAGGFTDIVSMLLDSNAATDPVDKFSRTPEMITHVDEYEELSALLQQSRDSRGLNTESTPCDAVVDPMAQIKTTREACEPYTESPLTAPACGCAVCKLIDISKKLDEPLLEEVRKCTCIDCLKQMAMDTITDIDLVEKTLETCFCEACVVSQCTIHGEAIAETANNEDIAAFANDTLYDEIDFAALDDEYEERLELEENQAPEDRADYDAQQRATECIRMLSEGDFKHINYRAHPDKALLAAMKRCASLYKLTDIVLFLLINGANIELKDGEKRTLLHLGAKHGNVALVRMLLDRGANCNAVRLDSWSIGDGWTPLRYAVVDGHDTIVFLLLKYGAIVDDQSDRYRRTLLHEVIDPQIRDIPMLKILLRFSPNLELADSGSATPLHLAISSFDVESAFYLLSAGAYVEAPGKDGYKPLAFAIQSRNVAMVQLLLDYNANVHCRCGPYPNALMYAAYTGGGAVLEELLRNTTAIDDLHSCDSEGRTVMHVFAQGDQVRGEIPGMLNMLSELAVDLDVEDWNGATPLHLAVLQGDVMMVSDLVDIGVDESKRNRAGKTALDLATAKRSREMVNILGGELKKRWYRRS